MNKDLKCTCGKMLGVKCLESQEIKLSIKTRVLCCKGKVVRLQCSYCNETYTEIGKLRK